MNMKKVVALLVVLLLVVSLVACGGTAMDGGDSNLVGEWDWEGSLFYTFNEDGTGRMFGTSIGWSTSGNTLAVCVTPGTCGDSCIAPTEWTYTLSGDELTLQGGGMTYHYSRR